MFETPGGGRVISYVVELHSYCEKRYRWGGKDFFSLFYKSSAKDLWNIVFVWKADMYIYGNGMEHKVRTFL